MSKTKKYIISQLLAIPFVALPGLIIGFYMGAFLSRLCKIEIEILIIGLQFVCAIVCIRIAARITGVVLCKIGFLPQGSDRIYPQARSWLEYEKESFQKS